MPIQEPSEDERQGYYYGLHSSPNLIARSSTTPWSQRREWPDRKKLDVATGHAIQQPWNDPQGSLQRLIVGVLTLARIDWTAIDILRVGYVSFGEDPRRTPERPVTMLISVSTDSTTFQQAKAAIIACKEILAQFNLDDVEVEIKESIVTTAASSTSSAPSDPKTGMEPPLLHPGPFDNDMADFKYELLHDISEYTGTAIGTPSSLHLFKEGTTGVYLRDSKGTAYLLTCRHVLFAPEDIDKYRYQAGNDTRDVLQPGGNNLYNLVGRFKTQKATIDESIEVFRKPLYNTPESQPKIQELLQEQRLLQSCQPYIDQFSNDVCPVLGRVEFSPPIELCSQHDRLKDWALVELSQDSFTTKLSKLRNKIPVTHQLQFMVKHVPVSPARRPLRLDFSHSHELAIGPLPIPEPELKAASPPGELFVVKHGKTTGFTVGRANGIHSLIRHANDVIGDVTSSEWCIIGDNAFSDDGDSGACVFDLEGRIGGIITSGLKAENNPLGKHDVTYASTIEWLLEDIARHGYDLKLPN
ncbi:hypothetical protein FMUND_12688 [Fusarium mundagurra]|uniref:Serine protease n=1 Tax=Fusarium mundagurra TaxID=1567541 RepID=A0A8H6D5J1_9HYPO|nr:hypothetical protein FMUND_12688 [Fusarium mundagurra]